MSPLREIRKANPDEEKYVREQEKYKAPNLKIATPDDIRKVAQVLKDGPGSIATAVFEGKNSDSEARHLSRQIRGHVKGNHGLPAVHVTIQKEGEVTKLHVSRKKKK